MTKSPDDEYSDGLEEQIKQLTAERDRLRDLLGQSYWHVLTEDISLAAQISEALKGQP